MLLPIIWSSAWVFFGVAGQNNGCPEKYLRFSSQHTFCKPANSSCNILLKGVSSTDIEEILKLHNDHRSRTTTGKTSMPTAANMIEMVWDEELAAIAQKHAESCSYGHDCEACRMTQDFEVGQFMGLWSVHDLRPSKADWQWFLGGRYPPQVIWASTWTVGCGYAAYREEEWMRSYYVCNYGPAGHEAEYAPYKTGPVCTKCPSNTCCDDSCAKYGITPKYAGLCKIIDQTKPPARFIRQTEDIIFCNFEDEDDCLVNTPLKIFQSRAGNYASVTLSGGQSATLTFNKQFKSTTGQVCIALYHRRMPALAGDEFSNSLVSTFDDGSGSTVKKEFEDVSDILSLKFSLIKSAFRVSPDKNMNVSLTFSVPLGKPRQILEIKGISIRETKCRRGM